MSLVFPVGCVHRSSPMCIPMHRRRTDGIKQLEQIIINSLSSLTVEEQQEQQGLEQENRWNKQRNKEEKEQDKEEEKEKEKEEDDDDDDDEEEEDEEGFGDEFDMWSPLNLPSVSVVVPGVLLY